MKSRYLTTAQLARLVDAMSYEAFLPLAVSLETGMRVGDVLKLRPEDVHAECVTYVAQKTGKAGVAPITRSTRLALLENSRGTDWCFPSPRCKGEHLTRQAVWKRCKRACEKAGIDPDGVSPHSCRKNFAVDVYHARGAKAAQQALQHSNPYVTESYILSDWLSGSAQYAPLLRRDIDKIARYCLDFVKLALDKSDGP